MKQEEIQRLTDEYWMQRALEMAQRGAHIGEIPVGAVIIRARTEPQELTQSAELITEAHNEKELQIDPTAHAEVLAIQRATKYLQNWRLTGCTLYVTLEPCIMCLGAIIAARFDRVVIGARDLKAGAIISTYKFLETTHFNHYPKIQMDILQEPCSEILKNFFQNLRQNKKT